MSKLLGHSLMVLSYSRAASGLFGQIFMLEAGEKSTEPSVRELRREAETRVQIENGSVLVLSVGGTEQGHE